MRFLKPGFSTMLTGATSLVMYFVTAAVISFHFKLFLSYGIDLANDEGVRVTGLGAGSGKILTDVGGDVYAQIFRQSSCCSRCLLAGSETNL